MCFLVRLAQHKYLLAAHRVIKDACSANLSESSVTERHRQASPEAREEQHEEEQAEEYDGGADADDEGDGDDQHEEREEEQNEPAEQEEDQIDRGHQYD